MLQNRKSITNNKKFIYSRITKEEQKLDEFKNELFIMVEGIVPVFAEKIMVNGKVVGYKPNKCHGSILTIPIGVALGAKNKAGKIIPHNKNIEDIIEKFDYLKKYNVKGKIDYCGVIEHFKVNGISKDYYGKVALTIINRHEKEVMETVGKDENGNYLYDKVPINMKLALLSAAFKSGTKLNEIDEHKKFVENALNHADTKDSLKNDLFKDILTHPKNGPRSILLAHLAGDESYRNAIDVKLKSAASNNYNNKNNDNTTQNDNNIKTTQNVNNKK